MKRDPGIHGENPLFIGFARGTTPEKVVVDPVKRTVHGRRGAAEPVMHLEWGTHEHSNGPELAITVAGWLVSRIDLNQRHAEALRDFLNDVLPTKPM